MRQLFTLTIIVLLLPLSLYAQKGQDFILTMTRDTLFGKVKFNPKSEIVTFFHRRKKVHFHASTIDYFGLGRKKQSYRVYKTLRNKWKKNIFVEVLAEGKINLYYYDTAYNELYTSSDPYRYYIGMPNQEPIRMSPRAYKNLMKMMLPDQPKLVAQMGDYEDVPRIIKRYNRM